MQQLNGQYLQLLLQLLFRQQEGVVHQITNDLVNISAMEPNLCELRRLNLHNQVLGSLRKQVLDTCIAF